MTEESVTSGFRWVLQNAEQNKKEAFLAIPSVSFLSERIIASILGEPSVKALRTKGGMNFNRVFLRLITTTNTFFLSKAKSAIVLAVSPNRSLLRILDECETISLILVIPKQLSDIEDWVLKWHALERKAG